jgi:hypothetical protein
MEVLKVKIIYFISDLNVWLSAWLMSWSLAEIDFVMKLILGLPGAVYLCLKIYREFVKKK